MAQPSCGTQVVVCVLCAVLLSDCPVAAVRKRKHRVKGGAPAAGGESAAAADEAVSLFNSGNQMFQGGRLPEAAATYRRAVGLQPTLGSAHYNLGATLGAMGLHIEAVGSYEQATAYKVRAYEGSVTVCTDRLLDLNWCRRTTTTRGLTWRALIADCLRSVLAKQHTQLSGLSFTSRILEKQCTPV